MTIAMKQGKLISWSEIENSLQGANRHISIAVEIAGFPVYDNQLASFAVGSKEFESASTRVSQFIPN
ncbi:hypothetical protein [Mangrovibacterium marinum]|uniref:hypothetical protein n=1 Tax=Mangrovibacterium marinum TaxID=1639118 RepID=UPI000D324B86|nr:hypothetical protein [Mangrovibacterium marinum]